MAEQYTDGELLVAQAEMLDRLVNEAESSGGISAERLRYVAEMTRRQADRTGAPRDLPLPMGDVPHEILEQIVIGVAGGATFDLIKLSGSQGLGYLRKLLKTRDYTRRSLFDLRGAARQALNAA